MSFIAVGALALALALSAACDRRDGNRINDWYGGGGWGAGGWGTGPGNIGYNPNDPNQYTGTLRISQNAQDYRNLLKAVGNCSPWCKGVDAAPAVLLRLNVERLPSQGVLELHTRNSPNAWMQTQGSIVHLAGRFEQVEDEEDDNGGDNTDSTNDDTSLWLRAEQYSADVTIDVTRRNANCLNLKVYHEGTQDAHLVLEGRVCRTARRRN